jgi:hypothetical protein
MFLLSNGSYESSRNHNGHCNNSYTGGYAAQPAILDRLAPCIADVLRPRANADQAP